MVREEIDGQWRDSYSRSSFAKTRPVASLKRSRSDASVSVRSALRTWAVGCLQQVRPGPWARDCFPAKLAMHGREK